MEFEITQQDIQRGLRKNARFCPVARSVKRYLLEQTGRSHSVLVEDQQVLCWRLRGPKRLPNVPDMVLFPSVEAEVFIELFDDGEYLDPCNLEFRQANIATVGERGWVAV